MIFMKGISSKRKELKGGEIYQPEVQDSCAYDAK
jgi:hypothetical protein